MVDFFWFKNSLDWYWNLRPLDLEPYCPTHVCISLRCLAGTCLFFVFSKTLTFWRWIWKSELVSQFEIVNISKLNVETKNEFASFAYQLSKTGTSTVPITNIKNIHSLYKPKVDRSNFNYANFPRSQKLWCKE